MSLPAWLVRAAAGLDVRLDGDVTDFPALGDDHVPSIEGSAWEVPPVEYARELRDQWPDFWALGTLARGPMVFRALEPVLTRGDEPPSDTEAAALRVREAWAARHYNAVDLPGVVAQLHHLVVGALGWPGMHATLEAAKAQLSESPMRQKNAATDLVTLSLSMSVEVCKADDGGEDWVVCTSPRPDRSDDVVDPDGLDIEDFRQNPIMLWQHDREEPIGTWEIKRGMTAGGASAWLVRPTFASGEDVPTARKAASLWRQKVVRAVSIGFRPLEGTARTNLPSDHLYFKAGSYGYYYSRGVLREVSIVSIPANADAVRRGLTSTTVDLVEAVEAAVKADPALRERLLALLDDAPELPTPAATTPAAPAVDPWWGE